MHIQIECADLRQLKSTQNVYHLDVRTYKSKMFKSTHSHILIYTTYLRDVCVSLLYVNIYRCSCAQKLSAYKFTQFMDRRVSNSNVIKTHNATTNLFWFFLYLRQINNYNIQAKFSQFNKQKRLPTTKKKTTKKQR